MAFLKHRGKTQHQRPTWLKYNVFFHGIQCILSWNLILPQQRNSKHEKMGFQTNQILKQ